jgi:hypothetical protein
MYIHLLGDYFQQMQQSLLVGIDNYDGHQHLKSIECDLIKPSLYKLKRIKQFYPMFFLLFSSKRSKHGKVDQKLHFLKFQI